MQSRPPISGLTPAAAALEYQCGSGGGRRNSVGTFRRYDFFQTSLGYLWDRGLRTFGDIILTPGISHPLLAGSSFGYGTSDGSTASGFPMRFCFNTTRK